jgi:hypothetical protein
MNGTVRDMRRWAAGILCALALLFSGVPHHPVAAPVPVDLADYVLPDGTIPDLCLTDAHAGDDAAPGDGTGHHGHECGSCCLSVVAALPLPAVAFLRGRASRPAAVGRRAYVSVLPAVLGPGLGARAPPSAQPTV